MGLELSGEIKTEDKNCESSENTDNMKPWGWGRSQGRKTRIGPPAFNGWVEDEPAKEEDKE